MPKYIKVFDKFVRSNKNREKIWFLEKSLRISQISHKNRA